MAKVGEGRKKYEIGSLFVISLVVGFIIRLLLVFSPLTLLEVEEKIRELKTFSFGPLATAFYSMLPGFSTVYRMLGVLAFLVSITLIYLIVREYNERGAEIATVIFSLEPHSIVYYSYGHPSAFALTFALLIYWLFKRGIAKENPGYHLLSGVLLGMASYFCTFVMTFFLFIAGMYIFGILIKLGGIERPLEKLQRLYEKKGTLERLMEDEYSNKALLNFKLEKVMERIREQEEEVKVVAYSAKRMKEAIPFIGAFLATSLALAAPFGISSLYKSLFGYIPQIFGAFPLSGMPYGQGTMFLHLLIYSPIFLLFIYIVLFEDVYLEAGAGLAFLLFILANPSVSPWNYLFPITLMLIGGSPVISKKIREFGIKKAFSALSIFLMAFTIFQGALTIYGSETGNEVLILGQVFCEKELKKSYSYYTSSIGEIPTFKVIGLPSLASDLIRYEGYLLGPPKIVFASKEGALQISNMIKNSIEVGPFNAIRSYYPSTPTSLLLSPSYDFLRTSNHIKTWEAYIFIIR